MGGPPVNSGVTFSLRLAEIHLTYQFGRPSDDAADGAAAESGLSLEESVPFLLALSFASSVSQSVSRSSRLISSRPVCRTTKLNQVIGAGYGFLAKYTPVAHALCALLPAFVRRINNRTLALQCCCMRAFPVCVCTLHIEMSMAKIT